MKYKNTQKKFTYFRYILVVLAIISPLMLLFYHHNEMFGKDVNINISITSDSIATANKEVIKKIETLIDDTQKKKVVYANERFITVDFLNDYYATLFTIIAIIIAFFGFVAWNQVNDLKARLAELNEIKDDVDFLKGKKNLVKWVQDKFKDDNNFIVSNKLEIENHRNWKAIKDFVPNETIEDCWLYLIYAKQKLNGYKDQICTCEKEDHHTCTCCSVFHDVYSIHEIINGKLNIINRDSKNATFYHMFGQFYWDYYNHKKSSYYKVSKESTSWNKKKDIENIEIVPCKKEWTPKDILDKSDAFYKKSLKLDSDNSETLGNHTVVLLEKTIFVDEDEKNDMLSNAKQNLDKIIKLNKATGNTYWDYGRMLFYENFQKNEAEVKKNLIKAAKKFSLQPDGAKKKFIDGLSEEFGELELPSPIEYIDEIEAIVYEFRKKWTFKSKKK